VSQADDEDLRLLSEGEEAELLQALEAALHPSELDPDVHERLLEMALEDPLAPASEEELIESARLRDALEDGSPNANARLLGALGALGAPFASGASGAGEDDDAVERALGSALAPAKAPRPAARRNVVYAIFGAGSAVLAAAAAVALFVGTSRQAAPASAQAGAYVAPHSTAPLFAERFETGDTTARMDLIASTRSRDLRNNRYASWGVR
jgi:hypothetical protein